MTLTPPTPQPEDPRLAGHGTDYDDERGGWYPPAEDE